MRMGHLRLYVPALCCWPWFKPTIRKATVEKQTDEGVDNSKVCNLVLPVEIFMIKKHCSDRGIYAWLTCVSDFIWSVSCLFSIIIMCPFQWFSQPHDPTRALGSMLVMGKGTLSAAASPATSAPRSLLEPLWPRLVSVPVGGAQPGLCSICLVSI